MSIRTFTGLDFINYVSQFIYNNGNDIAAVYEFSQFNITLSSSGSNSSATVPDSIGSNANYLYEMIGDIDWDRFPKIPDNALISKIEISIDISAAGSANGLASGGFTNNTAAGVHYEVTPFLAGVANMPEITYLFDNQEVAEGTANASLSETKHYTQTHTFNYEGAPITKAELMSLFTVWSIQIYCESAASSTTA